MIANHSLQPYNTFGIDVKAAYFSSVTSTEELQEILKKKATNKPFFILSGGSNMLLTKAIDAHVLHIAFQGITEIQSNENTVLVSAKAGES